MASLLTGFGAPNRRTLPNLQTFFEITFVSTCSSVDSSSWTSISEKRVCFSEECQHGDGNEMGLPYDLTTKANPILQRSILCSKVCGCKHYLLINSKKKAGCNSTRLVLCQAMKQRRYNFRHSQYSFETRQELAQLVYFAQFAALHLVS